MTTIKHNSELKRINAKTMIPLSTYINIYHRIIHVMQLLHIIAVHSNSNIKRICITNDYITFNIEEITILI